MDICKFIENECKCKSKQKYGNYCKKHKRFHLIDNNNLIIEDNFTYEFNDYLLKDLKVFYSRKINSKINNGKRKQFYYDEISKYITNKNKYEEDKIIKLQSFFRKILIMKKLKKNCNNNEDFYTYDTLNEIEDIYFYSYKDSKGILWGFDIRSIKK